VNLSNFFKVYIVFSARYLVINRRGSEDFFLHFFILSSGYIENKMLMVINISNHDNIKTTSNANGYLQIAITTHNYLQISNTKCKKTHERLKEIVSPGL
jgi:hypothetical protein